MLRPFLSRWAAIKECPHEYHCRGQTPDVCSLVIHFHSDLLMSKQATWIQSKTHKTTFILFRQDKCTRVNKRHISIISRAEIKNLQLRVPGVLCTDPFHQGNKLEN